MPLRLFLGDALSTPGPLTCTFVNLLIFSILHIILLYFILLLYHMSCNNPLSHAPAKPMPHRCVNLEIWGLLALAIIPFVFTDI